jgi:structural maintenance of chromosome 1
LKREIGLYEKKIAQLQSHIDKVEDEIFRSFCSKHGLSNIREYEERQLQRFKDANEKKTQFALVLSKLKNQLIFEGQQIEDTERKIQKIRVMLQEDLKTSEELLQAQNQYAQEREGALEGLKGQRKQLQEQRNGSETKNQSIKALKRDAAILLDDLIHLQKSVTSKVK